MEIFRSPVQLNEHPQKSFLDRQVLIEISLSARRDLAEITRYIAQNNPRMALRVTDRIEARINTMDRFPNKGAYVPELMAIVDSRRDLQDILIQKLFK